MKKKQSTHFIPILTTNAGRCLTAANWQDVGINIAAFNLSELLMKPGFELLSTIPDLASYVGWQGDVVLNATMPKIDKDGGYTIRSEYDGSRRRYTLDEIIALITQLKPQLLLLPDGIQDAWQTLPYSIFPFFAVNDLPVQADRPYGVYFFYDATMSLTTFIEQTQKYEGIPRYVSGELSPPVMKELARYGIQYLSSDNPARDALQGIVYCQNGIISLKDDAFRLDFNVIDASCQCPTCTQKLTRAYLHHLLEHTPLLCQRFLIQHNTDCA